MTRVPPLYKLCQRIASNGWRLYGGLEVRGLVNVPASGAALIIANHESNLDPILIQAVCPRPIHAMAKSTQFGVPGVGWLMRHLLAFPVRRYRVDPQPVRIALRRLRQGELVCIYVEGERSWDGRLQQPRRGTIRIALKAGVPVIPVTIAGSYDAWPRWDNRIQPRRIRITFGAPLNFPRLDHRADREAALPAAASAIMTALQPWLCRG